MPCATSPTRRSSKSRNSGVSDRTVPLSSAVCGMTLAAVPPRIAPTVTTPDLSVGDRFDNPNDITVTNDLATGEATHD